MEDDARDCTELYELIQRFDITENCDPEDMAQHETMRTSMMKYTDTVKVELDEQAKKLERFCDEVCVVASCAGWV